MCFGNQEYYRDCRCPGRFVVTDQCRQWTCNARVEERIVWVPGLCERCRRGGRPTYSASQVGARADRQPQQQQERGGRRVSLRPQTVTRRGHPNSRFRTLDDVDRYHSPIIERANYELQRARDNTVRARNGPWARHTLQLAETDRDRAYRDYDQDVAIFCRERGRLNNSENDVDYYSSGDSSWGSDEGN